MNVALNVTIEMDLSLDATLPVIVKSSPIVEIARVPESCTGMDPPDWSVRRYCLLLDQLGRGGAKATMRRK
jgi:hypothetical protein